MIETLNLDIPLELKHHGVKGMKWGVRRDRGTGKISAFRESRKTAKLDKKESKRIANERFKSRTSLYKLSDAELQKKLNRINMENNYNQAVAKQKEIYSNNGAKKLREFSQTKKGKTVMNTGIKMAASGLAASAGGPMAGVAGAAGVLINK